VTRTLSLNADDEKETGRSSGAQETIRIQCYKQLAPMEPIADVAFVSFVVFVFFASSVMRF
jgi:hypothetical protein